MAGTSPKTKGHGQSHRIVPMFARSRTYLEEAWTIADEGQAKVIPETLYLPAARGPRSCNNCNLGTTFEKIIQRAGLKSRPPILHVLRASCESDLTREFPITTACRWIGNTVSIAARHYVQVTDADFERASRAASATGQKRGHSAHEAASSDSSKKGEDLAFLGKSEVLRTYTDAQMEAAGIEPASRDISMQASTCVVGTFPRVAHRPPADGVSGSPFGNRGLISGVPDVT